MLPLAPGSNLNACQELFFPCSFSRSVFFMFQNSQPLSKSSWRKSVSSQSVWKEEWWCGRRLENVENHISEEVLAATSRLLAWLACCSGCDAQEGRGGNTPMGGGGGVLWGSANHMTWILAFFFLNTGCCWFLITQPKLVFLCEWIYLEDDQIEDKPPPPPPLFPLKLCSAVFCLSGD